MAGAPPADGRLRHNVPRNVSVVLPRNRMRSFTSSSMSLARAAWITVTAICAIAAMLLLVNGYDGYSAVLAFVGLSAAVNLLP